MELAPFHSLRCGGCQGFNGPLPSAFLDKYLFKELLQRYKQLNKTAKSFL